MIVRRHWVPKEHAFSTRLIRWSNSLYAIQRCCEIYYKNPVSADLRRVGAGATREEQTLSYSVDEVVEKRFLGLFPKKRARQICEINITAISDFNPHIACRIFLKEKNDLPLAHAIQRIIADGAADLEATASIDTTW